MGCACALACVLGGGEVEGANFSVTQLAEETARHRHPARWRMSDDEDYADEGDEGAYSGDEDYLDVVDEEQRAKAAAEAERQAAHAAELAREQAVAAEKEKLATACRSRTLQEKEQQAAVERDWLSRGRPSWHDAEPFEGGLRLFDSDSDAEEYSSAMLKALTGKHHGFSSIDSGDAKVLLACPAPTSLGLKLGSRVLVLKDIEIEEIDTSIRSGTAGHVLEFEYRRDKEGSITDVGVVVAFCPAAGPPFTYTFATCLSLENTFESRGVRGHAGEARAASRARVGKRVQLPLRLAFAASVSQLAAEEAWRTMESNARAMAEAEVVEEAAREAAAREAAATGLQAGVRGGASRRDARMIRAKKDAKEAEEATRRAAEATEAARRRAAAVEMQAGVRGGAARKKMAEARAVREAEEAVRAAEAAEAAAEAARRRRAIVGMQARARGRSARQEATAVKVKREEQEAAYRQIAATGLQAGVRGGAARRKVAAVRAGREAAAAEAAARQAAEAAEAAARSEAEVRARHAAAVGVQAQVRGGKARQKAAALKAQREAAEAAQREVAAVGLQAGVRGGVARRNVASMRATREAEEAEAAARQAAATGLQAGVRGGAARRDVASKRATREAEKQARREAEAAAVLTAAARGATARRQVAGLRVMREAEATQREKAAVGLQAGVRGRASRHRTAAARAQREAKQHAQWAAEAAARREAEEAAAATMLQGGVRGAAARKRVGAMQGRRSAAAISMQSKHRGLLGRRAAVQLAKDRQEAEAEERRWKAAEAARLEAARVARVESLRLAAEERERREVAWRAQREADEQELSEAIERKRRDARRRAQLGSEAMVRLEAAEARRQQEKAATRAAMLAVWKLGEKATTLVSKHTKQPYPNSTSSPSRPAVLRDSPLLLSLAAGGAGGVGSGGSGAARKPSRAQSASALRPRRTASGGGAMSRPQSSLPRPQSSLPRPHLQQLQAQQAQQGGTKEGMKEGRVFQGVAASTAAPLRRPASSAGLPRRTRGMADDAAFGAAAAAAAGVDRHAWAAVGGAAGGDAARGAVAAPLAAAEWAEAHATVEAAVAVKAGAAKAEAVKRGEGAGAEAWTAAGSAARPEWAWLEWLEAPALRPALRGKLRPHTAAARSSGGALRPTRRAPSSLPAPHYNSAPGDLSRPGTAGTNQDGAVVVHMGVNGPYRGLIRAELEAMEAAGEAEPWRGGRAGSTSTHEIGRSVQSGLGVGTPAPGGTLRVGQW